MSNPADNDHPPASPLSRVARYDATTHCVVFADGSAANVPVGQSPETVPHNYVEFAHHESFKSQGDVGSVAAKRWQASLDWRQDKWDILRRPPPQLRQMERLQPMYLHGLSKDGRLVMYEVMREADFDGMFQNGLTVDEHVERAIYMTEFLRHEVCRGTGHYQELDAAAANNDNSTSTDTRDFQIIYVKDMAELDIGKYLAGPAFLSRTKYFDLAREHYPGILEHAFCLHLPRWMAPIGRTFLKAILWGFPAPELLFPHNYQQRLLQVIDADQIPSSYGGTSPYALGEHPLHQRFLAFTEHYLQLQQQQQQQGATATNVATTTPIIVPTTSTTTTSEAIGSPCSDQSSSSSSCATSLLSPESTPAPGLIKTSSISISEHDSADHHVEVVRRRPQHQPPPQSRHDDDQVVVALKGSNDKATAPSTSSIPTATTTSSTSTNPLAALVATVWLGVWTFWSVMHSLVVLLPPQPQPHTIDDPDDDATTAVPPVQPQQAVEITTTATTEPSATSLSSQKKSQKKNKQRFSLSGRRRRQQQQCSSKNDDDHNDGRDPHNDPTVVAKNRSRPRSFRKMFRRDRSFETADASIM